MWVFLSGPMGSGKSALGRRVAERLGLPVYDLDALVEASAGCSVREVFTKTGEVAFRALEASTLGQLVDERAPGVVSLGGGTVTNPELRHRLLRVGRLITLHAPLDTLVRRVGDGHSRPLLAGAETRSRLSALLAARADAYAECHARVSTDGDFGTAVEATVAALSRDVVVVPLGQRSYPVEVGAGVQQRLADFARDRRVILVTDANVRPLWGDKVEGLLRTAGARVTTVTLEPGEAAKHLQSVASIWDAALSAGVDRQALVIGLGGGVVGDMAGFAAATLLRGVDVGHMPTSLLAMVDSSIGGKTGFDTRHGKNLVGAFHQPRFVLADVDVLATLPHEEFRAGLAEVVKSAWIEGEAQVAALEADADGLSDRRQQETTRAIEMSCRMKTRIVTEDEREGGVRAYLNLGHTVGHAIEAAQGYGGLSHGACVSLGMVAATRLATRLGTMDEADAARLVSLLERLGLPTEVDPYLTDATLAYMAADKKRVGDGVKYVVPGAPGHIELRKMSLDKVSELVRR